MPIQPWRRTPRRRLLMIMSCLLLAVALIVYHSTNPLSAIFDKHVMHSGITSSNRQAGLSTATPTRVHGSVSKAGPLAVVSLLHEGHKWSDLSFPAEWVKRRLAGERPEPPYQPCNSMYNDRYKVIYVKCPKTGGTTIMDGYFSHCGLPRHYDYCLRMVDYRNTSEIAHLHKIWKDYFVFGFTRNVLQRAVSQYAYLVKFVKDGCRVSWDDYCEDPFLMGDVCTKTDSNGKTCCSRVSPEHQYLHASQQANCLTTASGEFALDWLGRLEHFYDDFMELLTILNYREGVPKLPVKLPGQLNKNANSCSQSRSPQRELLANVTECDKMTFYTGVHAHCYHAITRFFAEDIALLT